MYQHIKVPEGGQKIKVNADFSLVVPDQPIIPFIEGDGTGADITPVMIKVVDAAVAKAYGGKKKIHWMEVYAGEKSTKVYGPDVWLPARDARGGEGLRRLDQGAAHHAGRRRHPLAQRRPAPGARSLRLPAADPVLQRRAFAGEGAGEDQHGHLPRELGGHLRRHRVRGGEREGEEADQDPAGRLRRQEDPLPGHLGHRHQAGLARRHRAAGAQGPAVRDRQRQALGDAGAQGQHHEVHRRGLPRLGLRPGGQGVRRRADRRRPVEQVQEPEERQGDRRQGRRSPTPSCSRSCCARPSTR